MRFSFVSSVLSTIKRLNKEMWWSRYYAKLSQDKTKKCTKQYDAVSFNILFLKKYLFNRKLAINNTAILSQPRHQRKRNHQQHQCKIAYQLGCKEKGEEIEVFKIICSAKSVMLFQHRMWYQSLEYFVLRTGARTQT